LGYRRIYLPKKYSTNGTFCKAMSVRLFSRDGVSAGNAAGRAPALRNSTNSKPLSVGRLALKPPKHNIYRNKSLAPSRTNDMSF